MKAPGIKKLGRLMHVFCSLGRSKDLARLVGMARFQLKLLAGQPEYLTFSIPKKDGSLRMIENPARPLKKVQRKLNDYLQAVYWHRRSDAAFGFLVVARNDPSPRHIVTNAQMHLGCRWLLNMDFEDFFHQVSESMVQRVFQNPPFGFDGELPGLLAKVCCHKGRLPMGAPTSPVLSNFACLALDEDLSALARERGWRFTRYADDLSFSGKTEITRDDVQTIREVAGRHRFVFNDEKIKLRGPGETKEVTGLMLGKTEVELPEGFLNGLNAEIGKLKTIIEAQAAQSQLKSAWVVRYKQQVAGLLSFAIHVMGDDDAESQRLADAFEDASDPPEDLAANNWLDFPYL